MEQPDLLHLVGVVRKLMMNGCTLVELSRHINVPVRTIRHYAQVYPEFAKALRIGGEFADNRVEMAAYYLATGFVQQEEIEDVIIDEYGKEQKITRIVERQIPPNVAMVQWWLKNRRGNRWKDKHEITVNHNIQILTNDELQRLAGEIIDGSAEEIEDAEYVQLPVDVKIPSK